MQSTVSFDRFKVVSLTRNRQGDQTGYLRVAEKYEKSTVAAVKTEDAGPPTSQLAKAMKELRWLQGLLHGRPVSDGGRSWRVQRNTEARRCIAHACLEGVIGFPRFGQRR